MECGHHTLSEIGRQHEAFAITRKCFPEFAKIVEAVKQEGFTKILFMGCGTSYFLAAAASAYFARYNNVTCDYLASFEFYKNTGLYVKPQDKVLLVPFTRVASTTETMIAVKKGVALPNVKSLQITCDDYSFQYSTWSLFIPDMHEDSIVMTSSFSTMLYTAMFFAAAMSGNDEVLSQLEKLPEDAADHMSEYASKMEALAQKYTGMKVFIGLGSGAHYGLAGESSIKVKEMTLTPSECYYSLEYRHGPISIAYEKTVIAYFVSENTQEEDARLIGELKALGACVIALGAVSGEMERKVDVAYKTELGECANLPELIIPLQYFGAYLAIAKGYDPDTPKNLSKAIIL